MCLAGTKRRETGALCADSRGRARVPTTRDPATPDHACFLSPSTPQDFLQGDCSKAKQKLNWKPRVAFDVSVLFRVEPVGLLAPGRVWASPAEGSGGAGSWAYEELVREMVDADVELMRNNPNA
ncbi:GDP-mannose 4,6 dehydratase [Pteropus alecto]|uniref:GDP-mannose 4,6 dehydratase n=1 Tax=Pteropus alecto TaxID=9402 RepID=L5JR79_PTEAL|nr:GDP-mannose 4,6 dehydratase [Pteropus alecto]